jgi:hypothetical protein
MFESLAERKQDQRRYWKQVVAGGAIVMSAGLLLLERHLTRKSDASTEVFADDTAMIAEYGRVELPGMSLTAPESAPDIGHRGDYANGHYSTKSLIKLDVKWVLGENHFSAEALQQSIEVIGLHRPLQIARSEPIVMGDKPATQVVLRTQPQDPWAEMVVTYGICDKRSIAIVLFSTQFDVQGPARRVVDSFRCTPDPNAEWFRSDVVVAAMPGWGRLDRDRLLVTNAHGVQVQTLLYEDAEGSVADIVDRDFSGSGIQLTPPSMRGDKVFWRGVSEQGFPIALLVWRCKSERVALAIVMAPKGTALDEGIALGETGRCLEADEEMPSYPLRRSRTRGHL